MDNGLPTHEMVLSHLVVQLEADGLDRDSYQLDDYVDTGELMEVIRSKDATEAITFHLEERIVTVSGSGVISIRSG